MVLDQAHRAAKLPSWTDYGVGRRSEAKQVRLSNHGGRVHTTLDLKASSIVPHHLLTPSKLAPPAASAQVAREASPVAAEPTAADPDEAAYAEEAREASPAPATPPADWKYLPTDSDDIMGQIQASRHHEFAGEQP